MKIETPRLSPPSLVDLADAPARPRAGADGERWHGADFTGLSLSTVTYCEVELSATVMDQTTLTACRFIDVRLVDSDILSISAPHSTWRDCEVVGGRIGVASLTDATLSSVVFTGLRIGYLSLRGSKVTDIEFRACVIDELDLGSAEVQRASFPRTRIGELHLHEVRLKHVDLRQAEVSLVVSPGGLRGAVITGEQLRDLAPVLAAEIGIVVD
ncbi:pentapeptide repeat-containing protein [soil metagenome]